MSVSSGNKGFSISKHSFKATKASGNTLNTLPVSARPIVNPADVVVPDGYRVEAVMVGLSFPTDIAFDDDGTVYVSEGGSSWPTRPYMPSRVLVMEPSGKLEAIAMNVQAGPRGIAWRDGELYMAIKGGYHMQLAKYNLKSGKLTVLIDKFPSGGWYEPGGPLFGADGLMYFGMGQYRNKELCYPQVLQ